MVWPGLHEFIAKASVTKPTGEVEPLRSMSDTKTWVAIFYQLLDVLVNVGTPGKTAFEGLYPGHARMFLKDCTLEFLLNNNLYSQSRQSPSTVTSNQ